MQMGSGTAGEPATTLERQQLNYEEDSPRQYICSDAFVFPGCSLLWFHLTFTGNVPLLLKSTLLVSVQKREEEDLSPPRLAQGENWSVLWVRRGDSSRRSEGTERNWADGKGRRWDSTTSSSQQVSSIPHKRQSGLQEVSNGDILMPWSKRKRLGGGSKAQKVITKLWSQGHQLCYLNKLLNLSECPHVYWWWYTDLWDNPMKVVTIKGLAGEVIVEAWGRMQHSDHSPTKW